MKLVMSGGRWSGVNREEMGKLCEVSWEMEGV